MNRRTWIKLLATVGVAPKLISAPNTPETVLTRWRTHVCESGTSEGENIAIAKQKAAELNAEVRFEFNYHRHYCVHPGGLVEYQDDEYASTPCVEILMPATPENERFMRKQKGWKRSI